MCTIDQLAVDLNFGKEEGQTIAQQLTPLDTVVVRLLQSAIARTLGPSLFPSTSPLEQLERIRAADPGGTQTDILLRTKDCLDFGNGFGRNSKPASELTDSWRIILEDAVSDFQEVHSSEIVVFSPGQFAIRNLFNATVDSWSRLFESMINCIEEQIEPSVFCHDRENIPARCRQEVMRHICVEYDDGEGFA